MAIVVLGGGNWTMPIPRFGAELVAIGLIVAALGSRRSTFPSRLATEDWLLLAVGALLAAQLVPLPPAIWTALPGRGFAARIDIASFGLSWRPLSLDPSATVGAAVAVIPALAVYLSARTGGTRRNAAILAGILWGSGLTALAAFAQLAMPDVEWLHFYPRGDYAFPVGLFTNHNHQALFLLCAIPLVAFGEALSRSEGGNARRLIRNGPAAWRLGLAVIVAIPLALATGSRTVAALLPLPLLAMAVALAAEIRPVRNAQTSAPADRRRSWIVLAGLIAVPVVMLILLWLLGGELLGGALRRQALASDQRWHFWPLVLHAARAYWPVGAGMGTFVEAFQIYEPLSFVSGSILNHAHNEYLQIALECGVPGLLLMAAVLGRSIQASWRAWSPHRLPIGRFEARMASLPLLLAGVHSLVDYPARTFAISSLLAFCWAQQARCASSPQSTGTVRLTEPDYPYPAQFHARHHA